MSPLSISLLLLQSTWMETDPPSLTYSDQNPRTPCPAAALKIALELMRLISGRGEQERSNVRAAQTL